MIASGTHDRSEGELWLKAPCADAPTLVRLAVVALMMDGARTHCIVMTDLTEQRRQSTAIAAERAQMQTRLLLADRMSSLGTLAAGVAHEINNPLAYVAMSLALIRSRLPDLADRAEGLAGEPPEWLERQVARAQEGAERVRLIVRDLKAFSRADDETMGVVDPRRALDTSIALASNEIRHRARLVKDYDSLPPVVGQRGAPRAGVSEPALNAAQAIPAGAAADNEIRVSGHTDPDGRAVIEVLRHGLGDRCRPLPLVFDPFFTTKPLNEGTGLGLSICSSNHRTRSAGEIPCRSEDRRREHVPRRASAASREARGRADDRRCRADPRGPGGASSSSTTSRSTLRGAARGAWAALHDVTAPATALIERWSCRGPASASISFFATSRMPEMTGLDFHARLMTQTPPKRPAWF